MPIFEFDCSDCGEPFEKLVRNTATMNVTCPTCGSKKVKKKLSLFASKSRGAGRTGDSSSSSCSPSGST